MGAEVSTVVGAPDRLVQPVDLLIQPRDMLVDGVDHRGGRGVPPVLLRRARLHELAASVQQGPQRGGFARELRCTPWLERHAEVRQDAGIQPVGLRQLPRRLREVPNLPGIDDAHGHATSPQYVGHQLLIAPGRFKHGTRPSG
jgi:hypothetical protein